MWVHYLQDNILINQNKPQAKQLIINIAFIHKLSIIHAMRVTRFVTSLLPPPTTTTITITNILIGKSDNEMGKNIQSSEELIQKYVFPHVQLG